MRPQLGSSDAEHGMVAASPTFHHACHCSRSQVVAYGISINLVEVTWKSKIKAQFPNPNDYSLFMGNFSTATGTVTFLMMLLSRVIFRKFGWGTAALITPTVLLITGVCRLLSAPIMHVILHAFRRLCSRCSRCIMDPQLEVLLAPRTRHGPY